MRIFSLEDKLNILIDIIISSPLLLSCVLLGLFLLLIFSLCILFKKKINKPIYISLWILLIITLMIRYDFFTNSVIKDAFDTIFSILYFPNWIAYFIMLFISNFFLFYPIIDENTDVSYKVINFVNCAVIDIYLFLIISLVINNNINVYDEINIYTNSKLLSLLEFNSAIFTSWLLINIFLTAYNKKKKMKYIEEIDEPEIVFEDEYVAI